MRTFRVGQHAGLMVLQEGEAALTVAEEAGPAVRTYISSTSARRL